MNRFAAIEFLKLYLTTFFLSTYNLPSENEAKQVIDDAAVGKKLDLPFHTPFDLLRNLITEILDRKHDLLELIQRKGGFLGKFSDRMIDSGAIVFPFSKTKSALTFLEKFLNEDFVPQNQKEIDELLEWPLQAVQFAEVNKQRTLEALDLLATIRGHLTTLIPIADFQLDEGFDSEEEINLNKYSNTKHCSCYVYEVSGDCDCLDDIS